MKASKRIGALVMVIVVVMSMLAVSVSAANTSDTSFTNFEIKWIGYTEVTARDKQDSSPVYLHITDSSQATVKVRAIGCKDDADDQNLTLSNSQLTDYVTCARNVKYKIHTRIYEKGFTQAKLAFKGTMVGGDSITGKWSPDSKYPENYTSATK